LKFRSATLATLVLAALPVTGSAVCADAHPLLGTSWTVRKVQGVEVPAGLTLTFGADRVTGTTGCNQFWAPVDYAEPTAIDVGAPQSKRLYCFGAMSIERAYLASLETVERFTIERGTLKMMMPDGEVFLELDAGSAAQVAP
jgi:heat shock protein HslJ